ncbi:MAG: hypothetical protein WC616_01435 [Candidatus Omnitrophota bacterium]
MAKNNYDNTSPMPQLSLSWEDRELIIDKVCNEMSLTSADYARLEVVTNQRILWEVLLEEGLTYPMIAKELMILLKSEHKDPKLKLSIIQTIMAIGDIPSKIGTIPSTGEETISVKELQSLHDRWESEDEDE